MSNIVTNACRPAQMPSTPKNVLMAIADRADDRGVAWPSIPGLCEATCYSRTAVIDAVKWLERADLVSIEKSSGRNNRFTVNLQRVAEAPAAQRRADQQAPPPVRLADPCGKHTSAPAEPVRDADFTRPAGAPPPVQLADLPVRLADPNHHEPPSNHQEPSGEVSAKPTRMPPCPIQQIVGLYREVLPDLVQVKVMDTKREKAIRSLWEFALTSKREDGSRRATNAAEALNWIRSYFERARLNDFVMGRTPRSAEHKNWRAHIEYVCSPGGQKKVLEETEAPA